MASSLEELLAAEGFKASSRKVQRSRSSFHHGASSDPLHSLEDRLCVSSSERIKTQKTKSKTASRYQISNTSDNKNKKSSDNNVFIGNKIDHQPLKSDETEKNKSYSSSESDSGFEDVYSKQVSNVKRGKNKKEKLGEKPLKDSYMLRQLSGNRRNIKDQENYISNSNSNSNSKSYEDCKNKNRKHAMQLQDASSLAIDEIAVKALVSILNGYIESFLKDEDFRSALRHNCFSSLNFIQLEEEKHNSETKVITSLEQAIECIEKTAVEETISATHLKRATMQLSIITGLNLNDLKYEFTCGIPNFKLSACAHLYLSVVYLIQRKKKVSAKHLLQVFCDSPFQARTILLPELWERLFSPQVSHLKKWYNNKEGEIALVSQKKARMLKILQKVYNESLESGTQLFALYYKDWLSEGVETPTIPSIGIPSLSVMSRQGSSVGHSFESSSSNEPFSPQAMVSKKLYDSFFGSKPQVYEVEVDEDEDSFENCERGSYGSTVVKKTLIYESETVKYIDQSTEDFTPSIPVHELYIPRKGTSRTAAEEWKERNSRNSTRKYFSIETNLNGHIFNDLPHEKANEISIKRMQSNKITSTLEGSYSPSIPQEFICPLTRNIFEEPVTLESGQTFERKAIKAWFQKGNRTCPVTGNTLECVVIPFSNLILKRLIDNWKSEDFDRLLDFASQTVENSKEIMLKKRDEAIIFKLQGLFSSLKEEEKSTYAKHIISLGVLSFLCRRFEQGNLEEKSHVIEILLNCIRSDSSNCIYKIARGVNRKFLHGVLHSKVPNPTTNAILFLAELVSMKRRKDVTSFISGLVGEDVVSTMHIVVMHLKNSSPIEKPLIAVLLLHFELMVEQPQKFSIYIEMAVNAIVEALDASLNDDKVQKKCCTALLILCGHFSSTGMITTKTSILKQAGYSNGSSELKSPSLDEEDQQLNVTISSEDEEEEERDEEFIANLLESMIGDGESPFLKTISRCLDSRHVDLVRACLITVTWLSSSLSKQHNAGLHLPAFLAIISQLKGILQNGELELKTLASMSLFNFSKISECRTLLKIMAEDIAPLLHGLVDELWTAKKLHAILCRENL